MADKKGMGIRAEEYFGYLVKVFKVKGVNARVTAKFLLVQYEHGNNREDELAKFLAESITIYATSKEERDAPKKETGQTATLRRYTALIQAALRRFKESEKSGELGELILFHVLERFEGAVQVINKMSIKTSGEVNFHGADAVHFAFRDSVDILFLGESKMRPEFKKAAYDAIESISEKCANKQQFEVKLAVGNLSSDIPQALRKKIVDYLDSTVRDKSKFQQTRIVLLVFSKDDLKEAEKQHKGEELIEAITEKYKSAIDGYIEYLKERCKKKNELSGKEIIFYLLPVKDVSDINKTFMELIGKADGKGK